MKDGHEDNLKYSYSNILEDGKIIKFKKKKKTVL